MTREEALKWIDRKIVGTKAMLHNPWADFDLDDRRAKPDITQEQVDAEVARLLEARKDVESWPE